MIDRGWTGIVLAGGKSSRMGADKALMLHEGRTLLEKAIALLRPHAREVLVIGDPAKYADHWDHVHPDDAPGEGPLRGLVTGLRAARYVRVLVVACDMPSVGDRALIRLKQSLDLAGDAVVPRHPGGVEPLVAAYHRRCLERFESCLRNERYRLIDALSEVDTRYLDLVPGKGGWAEDIFRNINSPDDL